MSRSHPTRERLYAYVDGLLETRDRSALEAHLRDCPGCSEEAERLAALDTLLEGARPAAPPLDPHVSRAVLQRALEQSGALRQKPGWRTFFPTWAIAAGVAGLLFGVGTAVRLAGRGAPVPAPTASPQIAVVPNAPSTGQELIRRPSERSGAAASIRLASAGEAKPLRRLPSGRRAGARRVYSKRAERQPMLARTPVPRPVPLPVVPLERQQLAVMVTGVEPAPPLTAIVRMLPEEAPGYARVAAVRLGAAGELAWMQTTLRTEQSTPEVVLVALDAPAAPVPCSPPQGADEKQGTE